jgi:tetratricopeptide (TPR) repeat protein
MRSLAFDAVVQAKLQFLIGICALLLAALGVAACSDRVQEAADNAALAQAHLDAGNFIEARESIYRAIAARDDVPEYFIILARSELALKQTSGAFNAYSRALDLQADNLEILQNIAELGLQIDRTWEADEAADRMLLLFPGSARAMLVKGFVAIENGRLDDARRFASSILQANPDDEGGVILSARLSALDGRFDDAVAQIQMARSTVGETEALNATLLEVYRAQGNGEGMRSVFPQVVAAAGQIADYRLDYINFLYKTNDRSAARSETRKAIESRPNDFAMLAALSSLFHEYDPSPFSPAQRQTLAQSGTRSSQIAMARFYLETSQLAEAIAILKQPLAQEVLEAKALASRILLAQGRANAAARMAASVLEVDPRNPDALLTRSARRLSTGRHDAAIEDANVIVSDAPQEYMGYVALANAFHAKGSTLRARQVFERGVDALPQSTLLTQTYAQFLRRLGDNARVKSLHADQAAASPSSVKALQSLVRVCSEFQDRVCLAKADRGLILARRSFVIDNAPGAPRARGLFSKITPEQICRTTGGICTAS